jgi:hypothetical protein
VVYSKDAWQTQFAIDALIAKLPEVFARNEHGGLQILSAAAL